MGGSRYDVMVFPVDFAKVMHVENVFRIFLESINNNHVFSTTQCRIFYVISSTSFASGRSVFHQLMRMSSCLLVANMGVIGF